jgi:glycosyltransferase involved in cell wall biosynthesis
MENMRSENMNTKAQVPELSVVIPIYNEEDNIPELHKQLRSALDPLQVDYEMIFIDDGSTDMSIEILKEIKKNEVMETSVRAQTRILEFSRNYGQTLAMQAGFDYARGENIVALDGDLQNDPADIPRLIEVVKQGYDVVCGWRKNRKDKTFSRILPSKVANWIIGKITGVPIHDNGCSLKAFRRSIAKSINLYSDMHRFIPAVSTIFGARVTEVVVNHRPRIHGTTKYGLSRVWKVIFDIIGIKMLVHFRQKPLAWFAIIGFVFFLLGFWFAAVSIYIFLKGETAMVFSSSAGLCLFSFGSLLSWGVLAELFLNIERRMQTLRDRVGDQSG